MKEKHKRMIVELRSIGRAHIADEIERLTQNFDDTKRLDWLADADNSIGNVLLPTACVENNIGSLREAIDMAMAIDKAPND